VFKASRVLVLTLIALLLLPPAALAQTPPDALAAALADLGQRAGRAITLDDLSDWQWSRATYPDTGLGCSQPGQDVAQVQTEGYRILLTYSGAVFDYRAPVAGGAVFLCSGPAQIPPPPAQAANTPTPTTAPAAPTTPPPAGNAGRAVCPGAMETRLAVGAQAQVNPGGLPNNVRANASLSAERIGQLSPGASFVIVGGPGCGDGLVWWQIETGDVTGWTAEGQNGVYWLDPIATPVPTPAPQVIAATATSPAAAPGTPAPAQVFALPSGEQAITPGNTGTLARLVELPIGDAITGLAWSPEGDVLAASATLGTWLFDAVGFALTPRLLAVPNGPTHAAAFSPDGALLATAHNDGTVRLWDVDTGGQRAILSDHAAPVRALAFSPDGALLASGGGDGDGAEDYAIRLWDTATRALRVTLDGHTAPVRAVAFSPDGTLIASAGMDGSIRLWDVVSATPGTVLTTDADAALAVAFSPDGSRLAFGGEDGLAALRSLDTGEQIDLGDGASTVRAVAFSADGSLLVTAGGPAGEEGAGIVWFWDGVSGEPAESPGDYGAGPGAEVTAMTFGPGDATLAFVTVEDGRSTIRIWGPAP